MKASWLVPALMMTAALPALAATPQQYDQALGKVRAALASQSQAIHVQEVPTGEAPSLVAQQVLGPIHSVEEPGQSPQPVDTGPLVAAVKAAEAVHDPDGRATALDTIAHQIATLQAEVGTGLEGGRKSPDLASDPAQVERSARAVLQGAEFASDPLPPPTVAERFASWLDRFLARFQHPSTNSAPVNGPNVNPQVILGIFIAIGVGAFAVLVAVLVQSIGRRGVRAKPLVLDEEEAVLMEARDNESLLALADQQAKVGDYRRAFRLVYLAALVALDTGGVVRFDRSKTNWEYLRALRAAGRPDVYSAMTPLTREFDSIWYGFGRAEASHYALALSQYQALLVAPQAAQTQPSGAAA